MAQVSLFQEAEIRESVTLPEAIEAMEKAFAAYSNKTASVPGVIHLDVPEHQGEVHIKAGYLHGAPEYVVKLAAGFWENRRRNLPVGSGLMIVCSAETGFPQAVLLDNGYLTELRTAAAGAVAAKYMARLASEQVAILGAGMQGRFQLQALACVRNFRRVMIYDHRTTNVARYLSDMQGKIDAELIPASSVEEAARGSRIIITTTPSRYPILRAAWVEPGTHITAMGSDGADKQELHTDVLVRADRLIADSLPQCLRFGEIHHAVEEGVLQEQDVDGELGDVISGRIQGRANDQEITVCDLTGVGVQDAAIAGLAYKKLTSRESSDKQTRPAAKD